MTIEMSRNIMVDEVSPWSLIGQRTNEPLPQTLSDTEQIILHLRDLKLEIQTNIAALGLEITKLNARLVEIEKMIYALPSQVTSVSNHLDDRQITSFMSLDDLNIEKVDRPDEIETETVEVRVIDDFTVPPPEKEVKKSKKKGRKKRASKKKVKPVIPDPYEGKSDEEIASIIIPKIEDYIEVRKPMMNYSLTSLGIVPPGHKMSPGTKLLIKEYLESDSTRIEVHKTGRMRRLYYIPDGRSPEEVLDEDF